MQWQLIVALVVAVPVVLFPAVFVWCLNVGGMHAAVKDAGDAWTAGKDVRSAERSRAAQLQ